jgi:hypothetical protein
VANNLQEGIKEAPGREEVSNLCNYTHSKLKNYNKCFKDFGKKIRVVEYNSESQRKSY